MRTDLHVQIIPKMYLNNNGKIFTIIYPVNLYTRSREWEECWDQSFSRMSFLCDTWEQISLWHTYKQSKWFHFRICQLAYMRNDRLIKKRTIHSKSSIVIAYRISKRKHCRSKMPRKKKQVFYSDWHCASLGPTLSLAHHPSMESLLFFKIVKIGPRLLLVQKNSIPD